MDANRIMIEGTRNGCAVMNDFILMIADMAIQRGKISLRSAIGGEQGRKPYSLPHNHKSCIQSELYLNDVQQPLQHRLQLLSYE